MNANELADMIDSDNWVGMDDKEHIEWEMKAATMLRQQQAEIEALKLQNDNYWVMIEILRQKVKAQEK